MLSTAAFLTPSGALIMSKGLLGSDLCTACSAAASSALSTF
jgi:hypothetical protein